MNSQSPASSVQCQAASVVRVLVVDDEKSIRVGLRALLTDAGYEADVAEDALVAQGLLAQGAYDVVVSDIVLPGISGVELLKVIRQAAPRVQVIMMTAEPTVATASEAVRSGASDYLTKPVTKKAIICAVATAVRIKALDDERRREQEAKERSQQELQATVRDLTAANDELRQASAFREEVEQVTRHDLKSPLTVILGVPQLIRMTGENLTKEQLAWLEMIEGAGRRLLDMINLSLDLFKMEQGMYTLRPEAVDLLSVAQEVISHNAALMGVKDLSAVMLIDDHPAAQSDAFVVPGERLLCYSMLGNLLKNAMEASPIGEAVTLRFESGDSMRMSIRNRGAVPERIRDRFFEKFSTWGKKYGTGLGTYSARMIAEMHGADISVDTSVPDSTTVAVCFSRNPGVDTKELGT